MSSNRPPLPRQSPVNPRRGAEGVHFRYIDVTAPAGTMPHWARRSATRRISPDASPPTVPDNIAIEPAANAEPSFWDVILEGLAMYGASFHAIAYPEHLGAQFFAAAPATPHDSSKPLSSSEPLSSSAPPVAVATAQVIDIGDRLTAARSENAAAHSAPSRWLAVFSLRRQNQRIASGKAVAALWAQWRRERDIRNSIIALETFGGRALRDTGLRHWSDFEDEVIRSQRDY